MMAFIQLPGCGNTTGYKDGYLLVTTFVGYKDGENSATWLWKHTEGIRVANILQRNSVNIQENIHKAGHIPLPKLCVVTLSFCTYTHGWSVSRQLAAVTLRDTALTVCRYVAEYKWLAKGQLLSNLGADKEKI